MGHYRPRTNRSFCRDTPANQRVRTGSYSWQPGESEYAAETLELAEIDVSAYSDVVMTLHLSATSTDTNNCGMWPGDTMSFAMALDGGAYPSAADITVTGNNIVADGIEGALWGFGATGVAATTAGVSKNASLATAKNSAGLSAA